MFVVNNGGDVSRFLDPQGRPVFNGYIPPAEYEERYYEQVTVT